MTTVPATLAPAVAPYGSIEPAVLRTNRRSERDERRLVKRLRRRDDAALRELYDAFGPTTFGFLLRILKDRATAEDVQQQVFLEIWQRADSYDPRRAGLLTWIMTIARSRAIDELRRRVPEPREPVGAIAQLDAAAGRDDAHVDALVDQWHLAHLLARLPVGEADLLRRRFYDGQSQSEIAAATGIPLGTIKTRMLSGLETLRTLMEEER
jgi:RNA polymerase sigma-70 factor (ECF subfamily)